MKKYTTTNEHGWMMEGIILSVNSGHKISLYDGSILGVSKEKFNQWINDGWVDKVKEPEFTDADMIDFAYHFRILTRSSSVNIYFKEWKEKRS